MIDRRGFLQGSGAALAALSIGNTPLAPIKVDAGGQLTQGGWLRGRVQPGTRALALDGKPVPLAADGAFLVAFDRDAPPTAQLLAILGDGATFALPLDIRPRAWAIEHINVARKPGGIADEDYLRLRKAELVRINAARAIDSGADGWRQDFLRPAPGRFSGRFGSQRVYKGEPSAYHSGLDIAGGEGTTYVAPADGVVILAADSPFSLEGRLLMLDHGMGLNSAFLHSSALVVKEGDAVRQGQPIGRIGHTGRATGPHLHWSIKWRDSRLDPILLLRDMVSTATR
ncbi:M23 family metallopeptidase [Novosphingobium sp. MMS21-SN21R]|uniref:M23 family metallopeptidase n=1 Tax=Novosphingobium sp. MMS21-SN21R TaxID=2969298 RepID=UPI002887AFBB|nr:M23 family metallopeptidase [Novosphingobium sp. MMS21-SN21R]MDT0506450.1 M23 family metallopeptidase [Novosphingobium sp. MMS21-SN21R]